MSKTIEELESELERYKHALKAVCETCHIVMVDVHDALNPKQIAAIRADINRQIESHHGQYLDGKMLKLGPLIPANETLYGRAYAFKAFSENKILLGHKHDVYRMMTKNDYGAVVAYHLTACSEIREVLIA